VYSYSGKRAGVGFVCVLDTAVCVVLEWIKGQRLV
jgi:hypothetical protein